MAAAGESDVVQAWLTKHSDPMYVTDLWFVVKEGENEIRIPACSAVLRLTCSLVRDLPEAAGDVPVLGDHTAATVVRVVQACYPFESEDILKVRYGENLEIYLRGLVALTSFAHWCGAQKITDRLLVNMVRLIPTSSRGPPAKATYEAVFSMLDVTGKWGAKSLFDAVEAESLWVSSEENYLAGKWPSFFLGLPEGERAPFERYAKRMFRYFLEFNKQKWKALVKDIKQETGRDVKDPTLSAMNDMHRAMEYLTNSA